MPSPWSVGPTRQGCRGWRRARERTCWNHGKRRNALLDAADSLVLTAAQEHAGTGADAGGACKGVRRAHRPRQRAGASAHALAVEALSRNVVNDGRLGHLRPRLRVVTVSACERALASATARLLDEILALLSREETVVEPSARMPAELLQPRLLTCLTAAQQRRPVVPAQGGLRRWRRGDTTEASLTHCSPCHPGSRSSAEHNAANAKHAHARRRSSAERRAMRSGGGAVTRHARARGPSPTRRAANPRRSS